MIATRHSSTFWLIGAGKFGTKAAERLCTKRPGLRLTVVDHDAEALKRLSHLPVERVCQEGASYLEAHLNTQVTPEWIIPAVPVHLAFEWVRLKLSDRGGMKVFPVPSRIETMLPNPMRGPEGQVFVSAPPVFATA